jgi:hypothetical protein
MRTSRLGEKQAKVQEHQVVEQRAEWSRIRIITMPTKFKDHESW